MNLENLNLVELNAQETRETEGGNAPGFWGIWGLYMLYEVAGNPRAHYDAFMRGFNSTY
jgi:hypothetical protein